MKAFVKDSRCFLEMKGYNDVLLEAIVEDKILTLYTAEIMDVSFRRKFLEVTDFTKESLILVQYNLKGEVETLLPCKKGDDSYELYARILFHYRQIDESFCTFVLRPDLMSARRFSVISDSVNLLTLIKDSETELQWIVGPNRTMSYSQAEHWLAGLKGVGRDWRIPTERELHRLNWYLERDAIEIFKYLSFGQDSLSSLLTSAWAESSNSDSAWMVWLNLGLNDAFVNRNNTKCCYVFGVRSLKR